MTMVDPTDVLALVLMAVFSMRRMDVRSTEGRAFPSIDPAVFEAWKTRADAARSLSVNACFAKFALNNAWFLAVRNRVSPPVLMTGGCLVFIAWVLALTLAWYRTSSAKGEAERLGIVVGRRLVPAETAPEPRSDG